MSIYEYDVVVVGSGVAGLSFAIRLAEEKPNCKISILSKGKLDLTNTSFAQGGIAAVVDQQNDSFVNHIEDTLKSGGGLSSPSIVQLVVEKAPACIEDLINYGVAFTRKENGELDLALEGGHSLPRVVHVFDKTGHYVQAALLKKAHSLLNITFYENRFAIEFLNGLDNTIGGLSAFYEKENKIEIFHAKSIVLATGGSGQVYLQTTNPLVATGDGIAMGSKVGAKISHLGFVQFHPTALYEEGMPRLELITEAIRGFGAYIVNKKGKRFIAETDERGELATRDVVSKSIFKELERSKETHVYLDCRHLNHKELEEKFPHVRKQLENKGFSLSKDLIPIVPGAHYQCGGLVVNEKGQTNIKGLYAIGECANTGLHGANRLASNALLEGLVFGRKVAECISENIDEMPQVRPQLYAIYQIDFTYDVEFVNTIYEVKTIMSKYVTIASDYTQLMKAKQKLKTITQRLRPFFERRIVSASALTAQNLLILSEQIILDKLNQLNLSIDNVQGY